MKQPLWVLANRKIFLKYDNSRWKKYINENINDCNGHIFKLLYEKVLLFDEKIQGYYVNKYNVDTIKITHMTKIVI